MTEAQRLPPLALPTAASAAWRKYCAQEHAKEDQLEFSEAELSIIQGVIDRLGEDAYKWHSLGTEYHRMFVRGYASRKTPIEDIATSTLETFTYREEFKVQALFKERLPNHDLYHSSWPSYLAGEDVYGHFVCFERIAEMNIGNLEKFEKSELLRYRAQHIEALMRVNEGISNTVNRRVSRYIFILDLKGFSMGKHFSGKVKNLLQPLFALSGDRYPDTLWSMFLVNAPTLFRMAWNVVKGMVDPVVTAKIKILGTNFVSTMVSQGIPVDSIPREIGGQAELTLMSDVIEKLIENPDDRLPPEKFTTFSYFDREQEELKLEDSILRRLFNDIAPTEDEKQEITKVEEEIWNENEQDLEDEEILFRGYLEKKGWYNRAWRKRFFILRKSGLYYYSEEPQTEGSSQSSKKAQPSRGKIDLLLMSRVEPIFSSSGRQRGNTRTMQNTLRKTKNPLRRIKMNISRKNQRHAVLGNFKSFSVTRSEVEFDSIASDHETGSGSGLADDFIIGFDLVTPYRTYTLRVCSDQNDNAMENESLIESWVQAIEKANEDRMKEMETLIREEMPIYKGFLDRKVRSKTLFGKGYKTRYFVLTSQRVYWYTDISSKIGSALKGKVELKKISKCNVKLEKDGTPTKELEIHLPRLNVMTLRAVDEEDAEQWVQMISQAVSDLKTRKMQLRTMSGKVKQPTTSRKKSKPLKNKRVANNLQELILDEDAEETIDPQNQNENVVEEEEKNDLRSVNTMETNASQYSMSTMGESFKGFLSEAIRIGTEMRVISAEKASKIPSTEELYNSARSTLSSMYGRIRGRREPTDKLEEVDITTQNL